MSRILSVLGLLVLAGCCAHPQTVHEVITEGGKVRIVEHRCSKDPFAPCP